MSHLPLEVLIKYSSKLISGEDRYVSTRFNDTQASINPLTTQGKALMGGINKLNKAILVKT